MSNKRQRQMSDYISNSAITTAAGIAAGVLKSYTMIKSEREKETHGDADGIEVHKRVVTLGSTPKPAGVAMEYHTEAVTGSFASVAGFQGVNGGPTLMSRVQFANIFGNNTIDERFYVSSMTQTVLLTNFTNTPIVMNWFYYVAKEDLDEGDVCTTPYQAMVRDISVQDNQGSALVAPDTELLNEWGQSVNTGYNLYKSHRKICQYMMVIGPYATRKLITHVDYSQFVNRQNLSNLQGNDSSIKGITIHPVVQLHGVVGRTAEDIVTLASTSVGFVASNRVYYCKVESSVAKRFQDGGLPPGPVTKIGNVDSGIISTVNKV